MPRISPERDKKQAIIDAVILIIGERGIPAVTHREVARRAGVSLAATTYYFNSLEDMIGTAFAALMDREIAHFNRLISELQTHPDDRPAVFVKFLDEVLGEKSGRKTNLIAVMEFILEVARSTRYRQLLKKYEKVNNDLLAMLLKEEYRDPYSIFVIQSLLHGIVLRKLSLPQKYLRAEIIEPFIMKYFT